MEAHIFTDNYNETIKVLCQQNAPFCIVKTSGVYSYHWTLKGLNYEMAAISDVRKLFYTTWHYLAKKVSLISTLHIWTSGIYSSDNGVITHAVLSAGNMFLVHYLRRIQRLCFQFLWTIQTVYTLCSSKKEPNCCNSIASSMLHFNFLLPLVSFNELFSNTFSEKEICIILPSFARQYTWSQVKGLWRKWHPIDAKIHSLSATITFHRTMNKGHIQQETQIRKQHILKIKQILQLLEGKCPITVNSNHCNWYCSVTLLLLLILLLLMLLYYYWHY